MANTYKNAAVVLTTTAATDLYTTPANTRAIVQSVNVANVDGSDRYATVTWYDSSAGASYTLLYNGFVPAGTSLNALDTPLVLEAGDILRVQASAANSLHATASVLQIDSSTQYPDGSIITDKIADSSITRTKLATDISPTIICTSGTRPASPFEGLSIYETNTKKTAIWTGSAWVYSYRFVDSVRFVSTGTFTKATYPWLAAINVRLVGGGGASGAIGATNASQFVASGGGGGGGYAEAFITSISSLASSVTVTVGAGGTGTSGNGNVGGSSSFGSLVVAGGGAGGFQAAAQAFWITVGGGAGGSGTAGDLLLTGQGGDASNPINTNGGYGGNGGASALGWGGRGAVTWQAGSAQGEVGQNYGGGGGGASGGASAPARNGSNGASGIVIVELYA